MAENPEHESGEAVHRPSGGEEQAAGDGQSDGAASDPRDIGDQSAGHSTEARDAQVDLTPEEREEQITSAAPQGGETENVPEWAGEEDQGGSESQPQDGGPGTPEAEEAQ